MSHFVFLQSVHFSRRPCGENVVDDFYTEEDMLNENITNVMEDLLAQDYNAMDLSLQYTIAPQFDDVSAAHWCVKILLTFN